MDKKLSVTGKLIKGILVSLLFFLASYIGSFIVQAEESEPYNVVVIMSDDQRWDTLWAMPIVQGELIREGVNFINALVSTPLCCPDRASFLAGGFYAHNTGVLMNHGANGGADNLMDTDTLATRLQKIGYKTAMIGKYLNRYSDIWSSNDTPYIPPGWTKFIATFKEDNEDDNKREKSSWMEFDIAKGSSSFNAPSKGEVIHVEQYRTDFLCDEAIAFLEEVDDRPFLLYFTPNASHSPATPAPEDEDLFERYLYRSRAFAEEDLSDKPEWVGEERGNYDQEEEDEFHRNQLRSLQAVDRAVGEIMEKLKELGKLERTFIVYTSDNGFMWGEHGLSDKNKPYEESIRVPLVVVMPGILAREDRHRVVANLDIPTTILELAGIPRDDTDGTNLEPLLKDPDLKGWRDNEVLIEGFNSKKSGKTTWAGLRGWRFKYVEYSNSTGENELEKELYDLKKDPYELENLSNEPEYQYRIGRLSRKLNDGLKGLAITVTEAPVGVVGQPYEFEVKAWGGKPPYTWTILEGNLPAGLELNNSIGVISGIPMERSKKKEGSVSIKVEDSSTATHTGKPQAYVQEFKIKIVSSARDKRRATEELKTEAAQLVAIELIEDDE